MTMPPSIGMPCDVTGCKHPHILLIGVVTETRAYCWVGFCEEHSPLIAPLVENLIELNQEKRSEQHHNED